MTWYSHAYLTGNAGPNTDPARPLYSTDTGRVKHPMYVLSLYFVRAYLVAADQKQGVAQALVCVSHVLLHWDVCVVLIVVDVDGHIAHIDNGFQRS